MVRGIFVGSPPAATKSDKKRGGILKALSHCLDIAKFRLLIPSIPFSNRSFQLSPCRHAQLPQRLLHHCADPLLGSRLREATAIDPVTKIVSQCDRQK